MAAVGQQVAPIQAELKLWGNRCETIRQMLCDAVKGRGFMAPAAASGKPRGRGFHRDVIA